MDCQTVEKHLSAWLDGELDEAASEEVSTHIRGCYRCRAKAEALDQAAGHIRDLPRIAAPADFSEKLRQRLESGPAWKRFLKRVFTPFHIKIPVELAAAAAVGVLLFFVMMPGGEKEQRIAGTKEAAKPAPIRLSWAASDQPPVRAFNAPKARERAAPRDSAVRQKADDRTLSAGKARQEDPGQAEARRPADSAEPPAPGESFALFRIRRAVEENRGKIRTVDRDDAGRPVSVRIGIPAAGYAALIDALSCSGEFRSPPPELPQNQRDDQNRLQLIIWIK